MNKIRVPGVVYTLLTAGVAYGIEYFTTGDGALLLYAPIALAVGGVILKLITVQAPPTEPAPTPQGDFGGPMPQRSDKMRRLLLG